MAFIEPIKGESRNFSLDNGVFNISNAVGANAANYWSDIQLIQYLIHIIYDFNKKTGVENWDMWNWKITEETRKDLADLPDPNKDFKALTKTAKWIRHFQEDGKLNGLSISVTSRVERGRYRKEAEFYETIYALNYMFKTSLMRVGVNDWTGYLFTDSFAPSLMKEQLRWNLEGIK